MAYTKQTWDDDVPLGTSTTPVNATRLGYMEEGIETAHELAESAGGGGATLVVAAVDALASTIATADYVCNGTADQVEIAAAIAALPAVGGVVLLSEGNFYTSGVITQAKNRSTLRGRGGRDLFTTTINRAAAANFYGIDVTGTSCAIEDLQIYDDAALANTSPLIHSGVVTLTLRRLYVANDQTGSSSIGIQSAAGGPLNIDDCDIYADQNGLDPGGTVSAINTEIAAGIGYGIEANAATSSAGHLYTNCKISGVGGLRVDTSGSDLVRIRGCQFVTWGVGHGIHVDGARHVLIVGSQFNGQNQGLDAIRVVNHSLDGGLIEGNHIADWGNHGVALNAVVDIMVHGNHIYGSGRLTDDTYSGIILEANVDRCSVQGNQVRRGTGGNQPKYGIRVDNSNCDNNLITNNDLLNSSKSGGTGAAYSDVGTGTVTTAGNRT